MRSLSRFRSCTIRSESFRLSTFVPLGSSRRGERVCRFMFPAGRAIPDLNHVVGNHTEPDPALHTVSPLQYADATFASCPPPLPTTKPALPVETFAFRTLGVSIGHRNPFHSHRLGGFLVLPRIKSRISSDPAGYPSKFPSVYLDRRE